MSELTTLVKKAIFDAMNNSDEKYAQASLTAIEEAGYVVVPREPTEAMLDAGYEATGYPVGIEGAWQAMIAAALNGSKTPSE